MTVSVTQLQDAQAPQYEPPMSASAGKLNLRGHHVVPQSSRFPDLDTKGVSGAAITVSGTIGSTPRSLKVKALY